jgi:hypothetical protein
LKIEKHYGNQNKKLRILSASESMMQKESQELMFEVILPKSVKKELKMIC